MKFITWLLTDTTDFHFSDLSYSCVPLYKVIINAVLYFCRILFFFFIKCTVTLIHICNYSDVQGNAEETFSLLDQTEQNAQEGQLCK